MTVYVQDRFSKHQKSLDRKLTDKIMQSRPDEIVKCSKGHCNTKTSKICWRCGEELT